MAEHDDMPGDEVEQAVQDAITRVTAVAVILIVLATLVVVGIWIAVVLT